MAKKKKNNVKKDVILKVKDGVIEIWLSKQLKEELKQKEQMEIPQWIADMYR